MRLTKKILRKALKCAFNPFSAVKSQEEMPLLNKVIAHGCFDVVEKDIIDDKINVNLRDAEGVTPLHVAASMGDIEAMRVLIKHGAKIDAHDNRGYTPLHMAAAFGQVAAIQLLIDYRANIYCMTQKNEPLLCIAQQFHKKEAVICLIQNGVNIINSQGQTPLHCAAEKNDLNMANFFQIHAGEKFDVNMKDNEKRTPLHIAASMGNFKMVEWLLEKKAKIYFEDKSGTSAIEYAVKGKHHEIVRLLILAGNEIQTGVYCSNFTRCFTKEAEPELERTQQKSPPTSDKRPNILNA